jgi:hypothetical protein
MADDNKHSERIVVYLTEREFIDASRLAATSDKKTAEYIRFALRLAMYGTIGIGSRDGNQTNSADEALRGQA